MGKVVLNSCGNQKVQVINLVSKATGLGLKEAKDAVDAVEMGTPFSMDVPDGTENDLVGQFAAIGADASIEACISENKKRFSEAPQKSAGANGENNLSFENREETLNVLYEIGKIAENVEALNAEAAALKADINLKNQQAEELRHVVSKKAKAIKWGVILCSLLTWKLIPVVITIIVWIVMNQTVIKKDIKEHEAENNANAQRYIATYVTPLRERLNQVENEITELNKSGKIEWAKDIVGEKFFYSACIGDLYDLVKGRRADNLKEALNLYADVQYKARMEATQAAIQNASEISAAEAVKQTAYSKIIAKNTHQAATAAKANAYHTRQIAEGNRRFK